MLSQIRLDNPLKMRGFLTLIRLVRQVEHPLLRGTPTMTHDAEEPAIKRAEIRKTKTREVYEAALFELQIDRVGVEFTV